MTLRLVLLVPFREDATRTRAAQLRQLIERFVAVFDDPSRPALVVVCEQSDDGCRFNRGQCLNAAYAIATSTFSERIDRCGTHFACHDVDMAPEAATKTAYFVEDDARDARIRSRVASERVSVRRREMLRWRDDLRRDGV